MLNKTVLEKFLIAEQTAKMTFSYLRKDTQTGLP